MTIKIPDKITEKYQQIPHDPGVYLMKDARGKIIYAGKAKDLKKRLSSYFVKKQNHDAKTAALIAMIHDFDIVITSSDHEAFILESSLIKEYAPKYNVILKDGKNYPLLRINMNEPYPAIQKVRQIKDDKAVYLGPYSSGSSINRTLKQVQKIFRLRKCKNTQFKNRSRPCLNYQIKACLGLCCNEVSSIDYKRQVQDAVLFLKGRSTEVVKKLKTQMMDHSAAFEYEKAAQIRDTIVAIEQVMERQVVVSPDMKDRDVIAFAEKEGRVLVTVMVVRGGVLIDTNHYPLTLGFREPDEILSAFLDQYYQNPEFLPPVILLSRSIEDKQVIQELFGRRKGKKVVIHVPERGEKRRLVDMAITNADRELEKRILKEKEEQAAILMLKDLLSMDVLPSRIECFDNSNLSGQDPVSSMVVFQDGRPFKDGYRKFIIQDQEIQDDYAYMFQVLERRFSNKKSDMPFPDLLVVDGGKGQLGMAMAVLKELNIDGQFMVAGLAKKNADKDEKNDKIYVPGRSNPLNTNQAQKALYLLCQVRDEAHRSAITFQRKRREKRAGSSVLDTIPGIGPKKKKILLQHFKGVSRMRAATLEEIASLPGLNRALAGTIIQYLQGHDTV
ncbi:MAG: excinuclease ABC subunit UvrC [Pseudomonadota bacterium]